MFVYLTIALLIMALPLYLCTIFIMVHPLYSYNFYCLLFPTDTIVFLSSFPLLLDLSTLLLAQMGSQVLPYVLALVLIPVYRIFEIQLNFKENQPEIDTHKVM